MKTITQSDYHAVITADIKPHRAFEAISEPGKWWNENVEGSAKNLGDIFTVRFNQTFVQFKITELQIDQRVRWRVTDCYLHWLRDKTEWKNTEILWEVTSNQKGTQVDMTHLGLKPEVECFEDCVKGWDQYIKDSLLRLLRDGVGAPERRK
jgi:hypothetical protein